jgi:hypothetical protein
MANAVPNPMAVAPRARDSLGISARVVASIIGPIAWICFTLLYVGFWAKGFSLGQDVIVVLVSILVLAGAMAALWAIWGLRSPAWAWS